MDDSQRPHVTPTTLDRIIERHRSWQRLSAKLSSTYQQRSPASALLMVPAMGAAVLAERLAWRLFVRSQPADANEARNKVLYLLSLSIGMGTGFSSRETALISASLGEFASEVRGLLQK